LAYYDDMKFIDEVTVFCQAGNGGNGCISFRREKYVPKGGPNGGDGGDGGCVIFRADPGSNTLLNLIYKPHLKAKNGTHGSGSDRHGKNGADLMMNVPIGTQVKNPETNEVLCDLIEINQQFIAAQGGKGGRGNARFATSTNRAPRTAEKGETGVRRWLKLELIVLADVGLIGFPSVGKSSLLKKISAARPKVAAYPFTTLSPHLGTVMIDENISFVAADLPGLVEGASEGIGLGFRFLKHIGRCKILAYILDLDPNASPSPSKSFNILRNELSEYRKNLNDMPSIIICNKIDLKGAKQIFEATLKDLAPFGFKILPVSAEKGDGIDQMIKVMGEMVRENAVAAEMQIRGDT